MPKKEPTHATAGARATALLALLLLAALAFAVYAWGAPANPPGFFIDESSVAYNAHLISLTGRDEHGEGFPVYFRAFGDYKNPTYVYLLAAVFRATGPSVAAARYLSAALGAAAAFALGLLGWRVSRRRDVGVLTGLSALLTPWLFDLSRLVVEVAAYPLVCALLLLAVRRASEKEAWGLKDAALVAASLALVTYTYSVGRLLGPLLALCLALFVTSRTRLRSVLLAWALYALALAPLVIYHLRHPGALTKRFSHLTYISPASGYAGDAWEFAKHYAANVSPWRMVVTGDPNEYQIATVEGTPVVLAATFVLIVLGAWAALGRARRDAWWRFLLCGLAASFVPASLTNEHFHTLRLAAVPVFLLALAAPALAWLIAGGRRRRAALAVLVGLTLAQGAFFRWQYEEGARSPWRRHIFDADYPTKILPAALDSGRRPVYLRDAPAIPGYVQAFWYAAALRLPQETFVRLPTDAAPPEGSTVITTEEARPRCRVLAESTPYTVCATEGK